MQRLFIWVEIPAENLERAKTFYEYLFQIEMPTMALGEDRYAFFPVQEQFNGGALVQGPKHKPAADGVTVYLDGSPDLATILTRVIEAGGRVVMEKTYTGKSSGYLGTFIDSEGNRIGLQHM
ncbi:VOC family protein [Paenibacillus filicis]|uniref:VOC family protein n=1 Tax=Paenibacillus gyeongsangnamensis TaxID=3388067 RepID=A0ABT4QLP4_9BACL|nr:VOC family protein [Paenibacillus filicis]MCZ8517797.1 VOC family protein [Paenibacillus filicis]